jgi:hypothetical protein
MTEDELRDIFPNLVGDASFRIASPHDHGYNCFAWAAGEDERRWDPVLEIAPTRAGVYWPPGVPLLPSRNAFVAAFASIGYAVCEGPALEAGYEKVVIYENASGEPVHASRQLPSGVWTSKLGGANDIEHGEPDGLTAPLCGAPAVYLRRPLDA